MSELRLNANRGGIAGGVVVLNGTTDTGYSVLAPSIDWGIYSPEPVVSANQLGIGVASSANQSPRVVTLPVRFRGASKAALVTLIAGLGREVDAVHRSGGVLRWKANNATYPVYLTVQAAQLAPVDMGWFAETHNRADGVLTLSCDPAAYGDAMSFTEDFGPRADGTSSLTDFTVDTGGGTLSLGVDSGLRPRGALIPSSTAQKRIRHTARGYTYTDANVTMAIRTGASVTPTDFTVGLFDATGNGLGARIVGAATNVIQIVTLAAGTPTSIASTAFTPAVNSYYWLRFRREGPMVYAQVFTTPPGLMSVAAFETAIALTIAQQQSNPGATAGARMVPTGTDEKYLGFDVRAYAYLYAQPDVMRLTGIPGDLPCVAEVEFAQPAAVASQLLWGLCAWDDRARDPNLCWNGGGQDNAAITGTQGWSIAAVANIVVASTSVARQTAAARYGNACLEFVSTVTADSGVSFQINRRAKRGRVMVGLGWLSSAAGTGLARIVLGNTTEGAAALSTAVALNAAWAFHQCVWTPTADRDVFTIGVRHNTGSIETTRFDGVQAYDASPVSLNAAIVSTSATTTTITTPPPEGWQWYKDRVAGGQVVILVDNELCRVDAIDSTTAIATLTIARGYDGTTAATHLVTAPVYLLDLYTPHLDGVHFAGGVDVGGTASPWYLSPATSTVNQVDANARSGFKVTSTSTITSQQWAYLLDPATFSPNDFEQDRMLVEVWARFAYDASMPGLRISLSTRGDESISLESYDLEQGTSGLSHSTGASVFRFARLGVLAIRYQDIPQRRRQQFTVTASWTSTGYAFAMEEIILTRPGRRIMLPTGIDSSSRYPVLMSVASAHITRRVYADLSSEAVGVNSQYGEHQQRGAGSTLGGFVGSQAIVLPTPNVDVLFKASTQIPNAPSAPAANELYVAQQFGVAINPTPRYRSIR